MMRTSSRSTIDLYDPATWEKYNWAIWQDDDFTKKLTPAEQRNAKPISWLSSRVQRNSRKPLTQTQAPKVPVSFYLMGAD